MAMDGVCRCRCGIPCAFRSDQANPNDHSLRHFLMQTPPRPSAAVPLSVFRSGRLAASVCAAFLLAGGISTVPAADAPTPQPVMSPASATVPENPLLTESTLPYHLPPFDKIKDSDFEPAYEQGMAEHLKEIEAIANNPAPATFENTVVAHGTRRAAPRRVERIFSNLAGANTNPALQKVETRHGAETGRARRRDSTSTRRCSPACKRSTTSAINSAWIRNRNTSWSVTTRISCARGAKLSEADKTKVKAINAELAALQTTFTQDVLKEKNADSLVIDDRAQLAGMPPTRDRRDRGRRQGRQEGRQIRHPSAQHQRPARAGFAAKSRVARTAAGNFARPQQPRRRVRHAGRRLAHRAAARRTRGAARVTPTTPLTSWTTRPPATWRPSTSCLPNCAAPPSPTPAARPPTCRRSSTRKAAISRSPPGTGIFTRRRSARRATTSTNRNCVRTSS